MLYGNGTNNMINQLYRQRDNIENMIAQYSNAQMQPPVQNIINTSNSNSDYDVKFLSKDDNISNIIISKKTLFIDEFNNKISIKEIDGTISKTYDIIIPKDEKDLKIEELENKLKELEGRINNNGTNELSKSVVANTNVKPAATSSPKIVKSTTTTNF